MFDWLAGLVRRDAAAPVRGRDIAAAWLFRAGGVVLAGIGVFFVVLRPPLLSGDLRFLGRSGDQVEQELPRLGVWPRRVFTVWGGHALAAGC